MPTLPYWILVLPGALWLGIGAVVMSIYWARRWTGPAVARWRLRRSAWPRAIVALTLAVMTSGCATTYRPKVTGAEPFSFALTPEQCENLKHERRRYHATQEASTYAAGAGLVCTGLALGFTDSKTATAICTGVGGIAEGVSIFTGTQVSDLDAELADGGCGR